jgi:hypothetical protein
MADTSRTNILYKTRPDGAANTIRPLTRLSDCTGRGLAMKATRTCSVAGCDRRHEARGYCSKHYVRWTVHGDPNVLGYTRGAVRSAQLLHGPAHQNWKGNAASYAAVHIRLRESRGRAAEFPCVSCTKQAADWSYDHSDPNQVIDPETGLVYSYDMSRYVPRCKSCHKLVDNAQRNGCSYG